MVDDSDGVHLYSLDIDTQEVTQLTSGDQQDLYPAWSPDRSQVAFASDRDGNFDLFVMNSDGSMVKRLTHTPEDEIKPVWSPDGTKIVYVQEVMTGDDTPKTRLALVSTTGDSAQQLTEGPEDDNPDWSSDGRYLLFSRIEKHTSPGFDTYGLPTVQLLDMVNNQIFKLLPNDSVNRIYFDPKWLPRNDHLFSMSEGVGDVTSPDHMDIFELKWIDGQPSINRLSSFSDAETYDWGPNGEWLVAVAYNNDFVFTPIDFVSQGRTSIWERGEPFSNESFYVDFPDWMP